MKSTKLILGLILAWALLASGAIAQITQSVRQMQTAATATGNGNSLDIGTTSSSATLCAAGVQVDGTFAATITFETTTNGTKWEPVLARNKASGTESTTTTDAGEYTIILGGSVKLRARISAYTSGSVTVVGRLVPCAITRGTTSGGGGGSGDVVGPSSATDNAVARFDGTTGKLLQNSSATLTDAGALTAAIRDNGGQVFSLANYADLATARATIGSTPATLIIPSAAPVTADLTIPATLTLEFTNAGQITISATKTLTILGGVRADPGQFIFAGTGAYAFTGNKLLNTFYFDWWGAKGDGSTDASAIALRAGLAIPAGGTLKLVAGTYVVDNFYLNNYTTFDFNGATLSGTSIHAVTKAYWDSTNPAVQEFQVTTGLTTGTQGTTSLTVADTTGFTTGDRVIVSGGNFTGGGTEVALVEWNTVASVTDGTHLVINQPLQYSYSNAASEFGITGASPIVAKFYATYPHDIRITSSSGLNGTFLNATSACTTNIVSRHIERLEVDHVNWNGMGSIAVLLHMARGLNWHDTTGSGSSSCSSGSTLANFSNLVESKFVRNLFTFEDTAFFRSNHFICEITCRDNLAEGNRIGPMGADGAGAIWWSIRSFNNQVMNNSVWGNYVFSTTGNTYGFQGDAASRGNIYVGNKCTNVNKCIHEISTGVVISGNQGLWTGTLASAASSKGIDTSLTSSDYKIGPNYWIGEGTSVPAENCCADTAPGSSGQVLYNNGGALGAIGGLTTNGNTTLVLTSNQPASFVSGPNGTTNPIIRIVNDQASQATGIEIKGKAAGSGVDFTALSTAGSESIVMRPKGNGDFTVNNGGGLADIQFITTNKNWYAGIDTATSGGAKTANTDLFFYDTQYRVVFKSGGGVNIDGLYLVNNDTGWGRNAAGVWEANNGTLGTFRDIKVRQYFADATLTAGGTTGAQTINKSAFSVNFAAAATSLAVTNSLVSANSLVICNCMTNDATMKSVAPVVGSGTVTLNANAAATTETKVACLVFNN